MAEGAVTAAASTTTREQPKGLQKSGLKRKDMKELPIPIEEGVAPSKDNRLKRRKIKSEDERTPVLKSSSMQQEQTVKDELADVKPDLVDLKRFQAMDDILRSMSSGMTSEIFRDAAAGQLLELAVGHDLGMLPGEAALRDCRDRLSTGGAVQEQDLKSAWDQVRRHLVVQCSHWQAMAGVDDYTNASRSSVVRPTVEASPSQDDAADPVGPESRKLFESMGEDSNESSSEDCTDSDNIDSDSEDEDIDDAGNVVDDGNSDDSEADAGDEDTESDDGSDGEDDDEDDGDDGGETAAVADHIDAETSKSMPSRPAERTQPEHSSPVRRPKRRCKGSSLPRVTHHVTDGVDHISATNSPAGRDLLLAVAIDDLSEAGHSVTDSSPMRSFIELEVEKAYMDLGKAAKRRWGRQNSTIRRYGSVKYAEIQTLKEIQQIDERWKPIIEHLGAHATGAAEQSKSGKRKVHKD